MIPLAALVLATLPLAEGGEKDPCLALPQELFHPFPAAPAAGEAVPRMDVGRSMVAFLYSRGEGEVTVRTAKGEKVVGEYFLTLPPVLRSGRGWRFLSEPEGDLFAF